MTKFNSSFEASMLTPKCSRCLEQAELIRELTARCAEYRKAQEWHPIATAPKDRPLLVWDGRLIEIESDSNLGEFMDGDNNLEDARFTHWRDLPAPPGKGEEEEK